MSDAESVSGSGEGTTPPQAPEGLSGPYVDAETPSGIQIRYYPEPHAYEIRYGEADPEATKEDSWVEVPSISTVLKVLDKPGLKYWGQRTGVHGVLELVPKYDIHDFVMKNGTGEDAEDKILELMDMHALTIDKLKKEGGRKGNAAHEALRLWAEEGIEPDPLAYIEKDRGYIMGLLRFVKDVQPEIVGSEIMVASVEEGFAGRYDLRFKLDKPTKIVKHFTKVKGAVRPKDIAVIKPGEYLLDLKTSGDVYDDHCKQIEGYEIASIESGYAPTEGRGILLVDPRGLYKFVRSYAVDDDFRATLNEYRSKQAMNARKKGMK